MHVRTTASKTWRRMSLSRKRPWRLTGERRMIWNLVVEIEAAKPSVRKVKFELFAQRAFKADAE